METPTGIRYRPFFPVLQSFYKQQEQLRLQKQKQEDDARKTALEKANSAISDYYKFDGGDHPYIKALEPYNQKAMDQLFELSKEVRKGTVDPQVLYGAMAKVREGNRQQKRFDAEWSSQYKLWEGTGNMNMQYIRDAWANGAVDLNATAQTGEVTYNHPWNFDMSKVIQGVATDPKAYNGQALTQKFITHLEKVDQEEIQREMANGTTVTTKGLNSKWFGGVGSSGQRTITPGSVNPITGEVTLDPEKAPVMLAHFRSLGPDWEKYLQLSTAQMQETKPEDQRAQPNSPQWGLDMQKVLAKTLNDYGYVGQSVKVEPTKEKTGYDNRYIGGSRETQALANDAALWLRGIKNQEPTALSFLNAPEIESAKYDENGNILVTLVNNKQVDPWTQRMMDRQGTKIEGRTVKIKVEEETFPELINYRNAYADKQRGWTTTDALVRYNQLFPKRDAPKKPAATTTKKKVANF